MDHGAIQSQYISLETPASPNSCWTEWCWRRAKSKFLRFGLCMALQRSCMLDLCDLKKLFPLSNLFLYSVFKPPNYVFHVICFVGKDSHWALYLIYWFYFLFLVVFQFFFYLEFLPIHWILLPYPKLSFLFHSLICSFSILQTLYSYILWVHSSVYLFYLNFLNMFIIVLLNSVSSLK